MTGPLERVAETLAGEGDTSDILTAGNQSGGEGRTAPGAAGSKSILAGAGKPVVGP
jgi:hypothetical protein